ncbi:DUF3515 domain-containing protein [Haloactinomyces albus]|uniref:DUF3515 domain-containing protein n=1 Tax=Haloactinomyces albus TaxID=1352928 RepID=A0AAE3ZCJ1_9ACTN|nr:DUF3515 domain-containing protein [Haloactinomyces albus]MDR7300757.1 hypothetical protein [Haloactinomyces albus]
MAEQQPTSAVPRWVMIVAITLGVLLAAGVVTIGLVGRQMHNEASQASKAAEQARRSGPLALPPVSAPKAESPECAAVLAALPRELAVDDSGVPRRKLTQPAPPGAIAWGDAQHDPIIVRCGITAPTELTPTSRLTNVSGVDWLPISQGGKTTWLAVDRPVHVALTVSQEVGTGPVQTLSRILGKTLPKQEVFP